MERYNLVNFYHDEAVHFINSINDAAASLIFIFFKFCIKICKPRAFSYTDLWYLQRSVHDLHLSIIFILITNKIDGREKVCY